MASLTFPARSGCTMPCCAIAGYWRSPAPTAKPPPPAWRPGSSRPAATSPASSSAAILATLAALRGKVGGTARILAVLEPRSNTMKMGISKNDLAPSLGRADEVFLFQPHHIPWQVAEVADACVQPAHWSADLDTLVDMVVKTAQPGDHILVMSNGGFGGIHDRLLDALAKKQEPKVTY